MAHRARHHDYRRTFRRVALRSALSSLRLPGTVSPDDIWPVISSIEVASFIASSALIREYRNSLKVNCGELFDSAVEDMRADDFS
jgi:hypothetical protein